MLIFMEKCGFCDGVRHAAQNADKLYDNIYAGEKVFLYGDLVNNTHVMRRYIDKGFSLVDPSKPGAIDSIPDRSIVVIRTHGISSDEESRLVSKNCIIKDYTCARVKKIHRIVREKTAAGFKAIIVGNREHPEVIGTAGWCTVPAHIVAHESDLHSCDLSGNLCVVAQTTCDVELWKNVSAHILTANPSAEINNTLCSVIRDREKTATEIAEKVDAMFVIGDSESSNSKRLLNQCLSANKHTFPITSLSSISHVARKPPFVYSLIELENNKEIAQITEHGSSVGLTASASTPDEVIRGVRDYMLFREFHKTAKSEIEKASERFFDECGAAAAGNSLVQMSLKSLREQNEGGKRIRGAMIKLGERIAARDESGSYLPIAVGYEFFQTSVLIHDDIIDKSHTRRNKATIHAQSAKDIKSFPDISDIDAKHYGISRALCIGDYGFFLSYLSLSKCEIESSRLASIYSLYSKILSITCEGEIMDAALPFERISIADDYEKYERIVTKMYECKTAWYTLAGPVMLGAICGGASGELVDLLQRIAIPLGIAFQIKDDLLGIYSSEEVLGKSNLSDIRENKQTLLYGFAYRNADERQRKLLNLHYGNENVDERDLLIIRDLFEDTGARKHAEREIQRLSDISVALISNDLIGPEYQSILFGLVSYLVGRIH